MTLELQNQILFDYNNPNKDTTATTYGGYYKKMLEALLAEDECELCDGNGVINEQICPDCLGTGKIDEEILF